MRRVLLAAGLVLVAGGALAQTHATLGAGPMAPCLADHYDPARYQADLLAGGWRPVPAEARPIAVEYLAQAFLPVTHPPVQGQTDDPALRLSLAQQFWDGETQRLTALFQFDSVLMLTGTQRPDGSRLLECWMVTPDGEFVEGLIAQAAEGTDLPDDRGVAGALAAEDVAPGVTFQAIATRQPGEGGPAYGILSQLILAAPAPE